MHAVASLRASSSPSSPTSTRNQAAIAPHAPDVSSPYAGVGASTTAARVQQLLASPPGSSVKCPADCSHPSAAASTPTASTLASTLASTFASTPTPTVPSSPGSAIKHQVRGGPTPPLRASHHAFSRALPCILLLSCRRHNPWIVTQRTLISHIPPRHPHIPPLPPHTPPLSTHVTHPVFPTFVQVEVAQRTLSSLSTILAKYRRAVPPQSPNGGQAELAAEATLVLAGGSANCDGQAEAAAEATERQPVLVAGGGAVTVPSSELQAGIRIQAGSAEASSVAARDAPGTSHSLTEDARLPTAAPTGVTPGRALMTLLPAAGGSGAPLLLRRHSDRPVATAPAPSILEPAPLTPSSSQAPHTAANAHGGNVPSYSRPASPSIIKPLSLSDVLRRPTR